MIDFVVPVNRKMTMTISAADLVDRRFVYTDEIHRRYQRDGFYLFDPFLTGEGVAECRDKFERMSRRRNPDAVGDVYFNAHQQEPWLFQLATHPSLLDLAEWHVGPDLVLWGSNIIAKPPGTGQVLSWHQDSTEWNIQGRFAPTVWIALDDIAPDNGGMSVLPGWHRKGAFRHNRARDGAADPKIDPEMLPPDIDRLKFDYVLAAGGAAIHHDLLPHYSPPNISDRWRRVILFRYVAADAELAPKTYPDYRTGERFNRLNVLVRGEDIANKGLPGTPFG